MSNLNDSFEEGAADAEARGCTVQVAESDQLFIDLDSLAAVQRFDEMFGEWNRHTANGAPLLEIVARYYSSSGAPKQHVILKLPVAWDLTAGQQIMMQAILGSDPKKELLTLLRLWQGIDKPIRLFKPKDAQLVPSRVDALLASLEPIDEL